MKKLIYLFLFITFSVSCTQVRDIAYLQNAESGIANINQGVFDARIKSKDILSITVVSSEPEASRRYNLLMPQPQEWWVMPIKPYKTFLWTMMEI